jgi:hypothetical protein
MPAGNVSDVYTNIQSIAQGKSFVSLLTQASAAKTASGNTADLSVGQLIDLLVLANITAVSGTSPTLQFFVDVKGPDNIYYQLPRATPTLNAVSQDIVAIGPGLAIPYGFGNTVRVRWVIGGTSPSFTFSLSVIGK